MKRITTDLAGTTDKKYKSGKNSIQRSLQLCQQGIQLITQEKLPEAFHAYNNALNLNPQDTYALSRRGDVYRQLKKYNEALNDLNKVLTITPNDRFALEIRNVIYRKQGN